MSGGVNPLRTADKAPPRRSVGLMDALVLEQLALGHLTDARTTARRIQDPTKRMKAFERIATAEGTSDPAPPPAHTR